MESKRREIGRMQMFSEKKTEIDMKKYFKNSVRQVCERPSKETSERRRRMKDGGRRRVA